MQRIPVLILLSWDCGEYCNSRSQHPIHEPTVVMTMPLEFDMSETITEFVELFYFADPALSLDRHFHCLRLMLRGVRCCSWNFGHPWQNHNGTDDQTNFSTQPVGNHGRLTDTDTGHLFSSNTVVKSKTTSLPQWYSTRFAKRKVVGWIPTGGSHSYRTTGHTAGWEVGQHLNTQNVVYGNFSLVQTL